MKFRSKKFYNELVITGFVAVLAAMLFGLQFHLLAYLNQGAMTALGAPTLIKSPGMGWYVVAAAVVSRFLLLIPVMRYKDKPILVAPDPMKAKTSISTSAPAGNIAGTRPSVPDHISTR